MIIFEPVLKWEVLWSAIQACLEQEIPFSKCHRRASSGALMNRRFGMCDIENWESQAQPGLLVDSIALRRNEAIAHLLEQLLILPPLCCSSMP